MIYLRKPYIKKIKNKTRLFFDFEVDGDKKQVWFEVDSIYSKYLCDDRIDAILVGLLSYAMRGGHDFKSDSYITEDLLFKIQEYLIPSLTKYSVGLKKIAIDIDCKPAIENFGGVGTGCSCGVDSFHAMLKHLNHANSNFNLTHLCINNVGAFNECYKDAGVDKVRRERVRQSKKLAKEIGLPIIVSDSNFQEEVFQEHSLTHTYSSVFAVLCLQKLWKTYFYGSSGFDYSHFNLVNNENNDCSSYELLSLDCFSTSNLKIYSEGGALLRLEKTEAICDNDLVKKYLHVCTIKEYNCGVCPKCRRTILSLYALLDDLSEYNCVFDIEYFNKHKEQYFEWIYNEHKYNNNSINEPTYIKLFEKKDFFKYVEDKQNDTLSDNKKLEEDNYYKMEYEKIISSKTFMIGNIIMFIPRKLKSLFKGK